MSDNLILITGGSGHVGFRTLAIALEHGYRVRLALRSEARFDAVRTALAKHYPELEASLAPDQLSFVTVPDMAISGAYDKAVEDVAGIIHIASSITTGGQVKSEDYHDYFIVPAIKGTIGMLESASKTASVKRVVITSSVVAIVPFETFGMTGGGDRLFDAESRIPLDNGPYNNEFQAYSASKVAAYNATLEWLERAKPSFDVVHLDPSFIMGRDDLQTSAKGMITGTNAVLLGLALGQQWPGPNPGATVHNEDVARSHVQALRSDIPAGNYILNWQQEDGSGHGVDWSVVPALIEEAFPEAVKAGKIKPQQAKGASVHTKISNAKTAKIFGFEFLGIKDQIQSVVGQYLELLEKEAKEIA